MALIKENFWKFPKHEDLLLDEFAETASTAKDFLFPEKHKKLVWDERRRVDPRKGDGSRFESLCLLAAKYQIWYKW